MSQQSQPKPNNQNSTPSEAKSYKEHIEMRKQVTPDNNNNNTSNKIVNKTPITQSAAAAPVPAATHNNIKPQISQQMKPNNPSSVNRNQNVKPTNMINNQNHHTSNPLHHHNQQFNPNHHNHNNHHHHHHNPHSKPLINAKHPNNKYVFLIIKNNLNSFIF